MLTSFWEGLGDKLSEKWIATLLTPAFLFWFGACIAWLYRAGWSALESWFVRLSVPEQAFVIISALLLLVSSSAVVQSVSKPVIRLIEGYWPYWPWLTRLRRWRVSGLNSRLDLAEQRWQFLADKGLQNLTAEEGEEYILLDHRLRLAPADPLQRMPTYMGNVLRAAELRPLIKYGLDAVICWPRLWLLLSEDVRKELAEAHANLDNAVRNMLWGLLFLLWTVVAWWAFPAGVLVVIVSYQGALRCAEIYGDLLEATFDLYRTALYEALHWPLPKQAAAEQESGVRLTEYLFRGTLQAPLAFHYSGDGK